MKLYSSNKDYKLYQGNMLDMLKVIEPNTIDSVITDPPYELNFMNKGWDNSGIAFKKETWGKCYEVLKPGGYLLAFGGSRTFHRIACAIEDAGFEIRDTIMWIYGMGFPKSMALDKALEGKLTTGNANKTQFHKLNGKQEDKHHYGFTTSNKEQGFRPKDYTIEGQSNTYLKELEATTELAQKYKGWGTALKPSYESIIIAQKPYSIEIYLLIGILDILNEVIEKCQLKLDVKIADKFLKLNQVKQNVEENIVLKNAENKMFTKEDLLEVMDMLQSILMENTNLNTELLCLNFLVEICNQMNKYTTEMKINLITELKILKLLVVQDILKNTIEENKMKQLGMKQNVLTVEEFLKEERLKLNYMNILSAQDNVILKEEKNNLHPNLNQIIVARKPFKGSLVDNVIEYGVGGINIDECRVGNEIIKGGTMPKMNSQSDGINLYNFGKKDAERLERPDSTGRFPANTILTYDETDFDEVCGGFPNTKSIRSARGGARNDGTTVYNKIPQNIDMNYECGFNDSGSASRYFYCAKASKKDRDEGLDEFEEKYFPLNNQATAELKRGNVNFKGNSAFCKIQIKKNTHPTVKPTELMQYLVRLVTPNGATILDPFNGSGSTGKAVMYENKERNKNYKYIGIELTEEYLPISKARIEYLVDSTPEEPKEDIPTGQTNIFDFIGEKND